MKETNEMRLAHLLEKALREGIITRRKKEAGQRDPEPPSTTEDLEPFYTDAELEEIRRQFEECGELEPPDDEAATPKRNLELSIQDEILTIVVDLRRSEGVSKTGRSEVITATSGNMQLWDGNGIRNEWLNMSVTRRIPNTKPVRWYVYR